VVICRVLSAESCVAAAGVYIDKTGDTELDHDVEVVGWGEEEDGLKYWLVSRIVLSLLILLCYLYCQ
jgi:hypothetical protein